MKCKVFNKRSRPVSRVLSKATIHLGCASPHTSSDLPESGADHANGVLFGLAPGGVYPAVPVTTNAVRSYRTISPLPLNKCSPAEQAGYFLWHCPSTRAAQALPGTPSYGARTFLSLAPSTNADDGYSRETAIARPTPHDNILPATLYSKSAFSYLMHLA